MPSRNRPSRLVSCTGALAHRTKGPYKAHNGAVVPLCITKSKH